MNRLKVILVSDEGGVEQVVNRFNLLYEIDSRRIISITKQGNYWVFFYC